MSKTDIRCLSDEEAKTLRADVMAKLNYDVLTGEWRWRFTPNVSAKVRGLTAGHVQKAGYLTIRLGGKLYYAGRLAWLVTYGVWPKVPVEFIDRNKANTAIANLMLRSTAGEDAMPVPTRLLLRIDLSPITKEPRVPVMALHEDQTEEITNF